MDNENVDEASIIQNLTEQCSLACSGKRVITIMDTTEINCLEKNNRLKCFEGLGLLSDNKTKGFLSHPALCFDADTGEPLGIGGIKLIDRLPGGSLPSKKTRSITEKESDKLYSTAINIKDKALSKAVHNVDVYDREGDIYDVFCGVPDEKTDLVIRSKANRKVVSDSGKKTTLERALSDVTRTELIEFTKHTKSGSRLNIKAELKFTNLKILKPTDLKTSVCEKNEVQVGVVEVRQIGQVAQGHEKVNWRILTTIGIESFEKALEVLEIYRSRWRIEEFFRLIKQEGFNLESSELEKGKSIRKLSLFIMEAALKIEKLKMSRDGDGEMKTSDLFDNDEIKLLEMLCEDLQGSTDKQKNPYYKEHLSWASWVIARLGGWKGFKSQRPPGSITFFRGLQKFSTAFMTFKLVKKRCV